MKRQGWLGIISLLFLAGCGGVTAVAPTPTLLPIAVLPSLTPTPSPQPSPTYNTPSPPTATPTATPIPPPPTPNGSGFQANQIPRATVVVAIATPLTEQRPPPMPVPLALKPDDHYWFIRPIPSGNRNYDLEWYPYGNDVLLPELEAYRIHHGLDFPNQSGTPILAAASGTVVYAGFLPSPRDGVSYYGNTIIIEHDWEWHGRKVYTLYAHTLEMFVTIGEHVEQGELIAGVGSSGEVSGPHLHFEVRVGENQYNSTRNPVLWMAPFEGWGTLAGRFSDSRGRLIANAGVSVRPVNRQTAVRAQYTYVDEGVTPDDILRENFAIGDLPAGDYILLVTFNGNTYRRDITIYPGQTTFEIIATEFQYSPPAPTATPVPTALPTTNEPTPETP